MLIRQSRLFAGISGFRITASKANVADVLFSNYIQLTLLCVYFALFLLRQNTGVLCALLVNINLINDTLM